MQYKGRPITFRNNRSRLSTWTTVVWWGCERIGFIRRSVIQRGWVHELHGGCYPSPGSAAMAMIDFVTRKREKDGDQ